MVENQISISNRSFLRGGGEMGELTRAFDWSRTPLGDPEEWPLSLRTLVGMVLTSKFPMVLFWGPDLTTFYNDAFRPSLGNEGKHPSSLGQRGEEAWAETWSTIGPLIHGILAGGDAVWFEDQKLPIYRYGKIDYAYWTYSYSPVTNDAGAIAGVLATCSETTKAVENLERNQAIQERVEKSRQQLLGLFEQSPVAIAIISREALTFRVVNPFYAELVGRTPEQLIDKAMLEALPEFEGQGFERLLQEVIDTGVPFNANEVATIIHRAPGLETIYVNLTYQPLKEEDNSISGVLVVATDVTQQVRARNQIKKDEVRFRSLVEEAPLAICLFVGKDMRVEVANDIMLHAWGKDATIIGKPLGEGVPELIGQPFLDILDHIYESGETYTAIGAEAQLKQGDEIATYYYDFTYKPLFDEQGKVYAIMDMALDVTKQVRARKQLEENELFTRNIIDSSPIAEMVFVGREMTITTANQNMLAMLGRDESIVGKNFMEAVPELIPTPIMDRLRHVYETGVTYVQPEEEIVLIKDGKPYTGYYNYIYKALHNTSGNIYGIMNTATEVTSQVLSRNKAEAAELLLRSAVELAGLATWSLNIQDWKITGSERFRDWAGIDLNSQPFEAFTAFMRDEDRSKLFNTIAAAISDQYSVFDTELTVINRLTWKKRIIHIQGQVLHDISGKPLELRGAAMDVTLVRQTQLTLENEVQTRTEELAAVVEELRTTNEELASTNSQLKRSNEDLGQYAYVASHDLQEPLRKIRMFSTTLLAKNEGMPEDISKLVGKINTSAQRMSLLINDLLDFSRLLKSDNLFMPVNLNEVVTSVLDDFELLTEEKKAQISVGNHLPRIQAVKLQMNQLFYNLLNNAVKFSRPGVAPDIWIESTVLSLEEAEEFIPQTMSYARYHHITIKDNGIGFETEYAEQIFEVFKRLHNLSVYPGSGIGLAICRRIADNHKGRLYADSKPGEGSVFHLILPDVQQDFSSSLPADFSRTVS